MKRTRLSRSSASAASKQGVRFVTYTICVRSGGRSSEGRCSKAPLVVELQKGGNAAGGS